MELIKIAFLSRRVKYKRTTEHDNAKVLILFSVLNLYTDRGTGLFIVRGTYDERMIILKKFKKKLDSTLDGA